MTVDCNRCGGSGLFLSRKCYSCMGKGYMSEADQLRRVRRLAFGKRVTWLPYADH